MTETERDQRCALTVAARIDCADIIGGAHALFHSSDTDTDAFEVERIRGALADLNKAFNDAFPAVTP